MYNKIYSTAGFHQGSTNSTWLAQLKFIPYAPAFNEIVIAVILGF